MSYSFEKPNITTLEGYEQVQLRGCMQWPDSPRCLGRA